MAPPTPGQRRRLPAEPAAGRRGRRHPSYTLSPTFAVPNYVHGGARKLVVVADYYGSQFDINRANNTASADVTVGARTWR